MFDGQVKVSGTVRELVFDDTVADIYLGPTLTRAPAQRASRRTTTDARRTHRLMKAGLSQSTQLKQELKINPRLYQAMDLLYMPLLDLQQHLKQELLNNPFLDMVEPEEDEEEPRREVTEQEADDSEPEEKADQRRDRLGGDPPRRLRRRRPARGARRARVLRAGHRRHARPRPTTCSTRSRCSTSTPRQQFLADEFIGNINEDGYLACPLEKICTRRSTTTSSRRPKPPIASIEDLPLYTCPRAEEMLGDHPESRSAGRRRARPARVSHAAAQAKRGSSSRCRTASSATASRS